jgi:hypothetical protein
MALERIDQEKTEYDWQFRSVPRAEVLSGLARSLLATEQNKLLSRLVDHALASPQKYPLTETHIAALTALGPWIKKHVKKPSPPLSLWLEACSEQLEALTAQEPKPPADFRRDAPVVCNCADCDELRRFLQDPQQEVHHFKASQNRRGHLEDQIRGGRCDLDLETDQRGRPYTLVCTKNQASHRARLLKFKQDQEHLAALRSVQASVPK